MLALPVYRRGGIYYLHTRVAGKQLKRSLGTSIKWVAMIRAAKILEALMVKKFEIDLNNGVFKADDESDFNRMILALETIHKLGLKPQSGSNPINPPQPPQGGLEKQPLFDSSTKKKGLRVIEVLDKLFLLKKNLSIATVQTYKNTMTEFSSFLKNPYLEDVLKSDISRYQEKLAETNSLRTIDNKTAVIRALFNFAIKQGYYFSENPAKERSLLTKKEKISSGYSIFNSDEIKHYFTSDLFLIEKQKDPDYFYSLILALFSGSRVSEITGIQTKDIQKQIGFYVFRINKSKTNAGIRSIPISSVILDYFAFNQFIEGKDKLFKYQQRDGKGSGNAVGKKFTRHLIELKIMRDKLVFHSLRKFTNDFFSKNSVSLEARSQYFGHEIDNTNINYYTTSYEVSDLFLAVKPAQFKLFNLIATS